MSNRPYLLKQWHQPWFPLSSTASPLHRLCRCRSVDVSSSRSRPRRLDTRHRLTHYNRAVRHRRETDRNPQFYRGPTDSIMASSEDLMALSTAILNSPRAALAKNRAPALTLRRAVSFPSHNKNEAERLTRLLSIVRFLLSTTQVVTKREYLILTSERSDRNTPSITPSRT